MLNNSLHNKGLTHSANTQVKLFIIKTGFN